MSKRPTPEEILNPIVLRWKDIPMNEANQRAKYQEIADALHKHGYAIAVETKPQIDVDVDPQRGESIEDHGRTDAEGPHE